MGALLLQRTVFIYKMILIHVVVQTNSSPYLLVKIGGFPHHEIQHEYGYKNNDRGKKYLTKITF